MALHEVTHQGLCLHRRCMFRLQDGNQMLQVRYGVLKTQRRRMACAAEPMLLQDLYTRRVDRRCCHHGQLRLHRLLCQAMQATLPG